MAKAVASASLDVPAGVATFAIEGRLVGAGQPPYLIAEVAQAHDGSLGFAHAFIDAAAEAGADAIKFQTHFADEESTRDEPFRVKFSKQDATRFDYWKRMEFTDEQWAGLADHAREKKLHFISSAFSVRAVELARAARHAGLEGGLRRGALTRISPADLAKTGKARAAEHRHEPLRRDRDRLRGLAGRGRPGRDPAMHQPLSDAVAGGRPQRHRRIAPPLSDARSGCPTIPGQVYPALIAMARGASI